LKTKQFLQQYIFLKINKETTCLLSHILPKKSCFTVFRPPTSNV